MATLKDVAAAAGVSVTTVSLVANGKGAEGRISEDTIQKVLEVMEQLEYRPNQNARQLRSSAAPRTVIGFYWPTDTRSNLLGTRLMHFLDVVQEQGLDYEIVVQTYRLRHIGDFLDPVRRGKYDGIIVGASSDADLTQLEEADLKLPVILLNRSSRKYSTVGVNDAQVGTQAAALLRKKGYPSCALVRSTGMFMGSTSRMKAFLFACRELGIEIRPDWTFTGEASIEGGVKATEEFCSLAQRPQVLFFEQDIMVQGGLYTLLHSGLRVPEDVELLAMGNLEPERLAYLVPSVSCVSLPQNVDRQAMYTMIRILKEDIKHPLHVELEPRVQLRESFRV